MLLVWGGDVCFVEVNSVISTLTVLGADVILCMKFCKAKACWAGLVVGFVSVQFASSKGRKKKTKQNNHHSTYSNDFETDIKWVESEYQKHISNLFTN